MKIQPNYTIQKIQNNKKIKENERYNFSKGLMTDTFVRTTQPSFKSVARAEAIIEKFAPKVGLFERNPKKMALAGFFLMFDKYPEIAIRPENINNLLREFEDEPKVLKELLTKPTDLESRVYYTPISKLTENAKDLHSDTATLMTDIFKKEPETFLELISTMDYEANTIVSQFYDNETAEKVMYDVFEGRNDLLAKAVLKQDASGYTYAHRIFPDKYLKLIERLSSTPELLTDVLTTYEKVFNSSSVAMNNLVYLDNAMDLLNGRPDLKGRVLDSLRDGFVGTTSAYFKEYLRDYQDKPEELSKVYEKYKEPLAKGLLASPIKFDTYKEIFKETPEILKDLFFIQNPYNKDTLATIYAKAYPSGFYDMLEMFKDDKELIESLKTMKNSDGEFLVNILPPDDRVKAIVGSDYVETLQTTKLTALREKKMDNEEYFETLKANKDNKDVLNILLDKFEDLTPSRIPPEEALMLIEAEKSLNRDPNHPITKKLAIYFCVAEKPYNYIKNNDIEGFKNFNKILFEVPGLIESVYGEVSTKAPMASIVILNYANKEDFINEVYKVLADKPECIVEQFLYNSALRLMYTNSEDNLVELYPRIRKAKNIDKLMDFIKSNIKDVSFYSRAYDVLSNCILADKISQKYNAHILNDNQVLEIMEQNELDKTFLSTSFEKAGRPLIHAFLDVQINDKNKDRYLNIVEKLKKLDIDWNNKDIMDVSLIEKVINSENALLIDLIKDKELEWNPYLDFAYNRVQSEDFKTLLKTLNFKFTDLIQSVKVESLEAFEKTIGQLNSPLCNREKTIAEIISAIKEISNVKGMDFIKILAENL